MNICLPKGIYYSTKNIPDYNDTSNNILIKNIDKIIAYNGDEWRDYRLYDTIGGKNHNLGPEKLKTIIKKWPNSLIHKNFLLKENKNIKYNDDTELNKLLDEHEIMNFNNYDNNYSNAYTLEMVLHESIIRDI